MLTIQNKKRPIEYYSSEAPVQVLAVHKPGLIQVIRTVFVGH